MHLVLSLLGCGWLGASADPAPPEPAPLAAPGVEVRCPAEPRPLAATWWAPTGAGPFPTAVILVGARPWDRWGDTAEAPWGHYRDIALALVNSGAAVLAFDKGGTGATGGDAGDLVARGVETQAAVACALAQPGADPARVSLVGHSQGSTVAVHAAIRGAPVQGLVLLSPGVDVDALAALPEGLSLTLVRGALDGADADDKRLRVLEARRMKARHVVIPSADHLLLDASARVPKPTDPATAVHPAALRVIADAVTRLGRSEP